MKQRTNLLIIYFLIINLISTSLFAQEQLKIGKDTLQEGFFQKIPYKQLILPVSAMTYGLIARNNASIKAEEMNLINKINADPSESIRVDDITLFIPSAAVYGLDFLGVNSKHNLKERLFLSTVSHIIALSTVYTMKNSIETLRPDGTDYKSFPSGHTAIAFTGAEMLWQEYKDESIWYGIGGYAVATGTGFLRMYNHRHYLSDVAMGAGIGILSTKIAYWLLPLVDKRLQAKHSDTVKMIAPFYNGQQFGMTSSIRF